MSRAVVLDILILVKKFSAFHKKTITVYRIRNIPLFVPFLSQNNPFHASHLIYLRYILILSDFPCL